VTSNEFLDRVVTAIVWRDFHRILQEHDGLGYMRAVVWMNSTDRARRSVYGIVASEGHVASGT
jgi:hypothetical protein